MSKKKSHKITLNLDPEHIIAEKWLREKSIAVPFVLDENGQNVYQLKFHPVRPPANPIVYNRKDGLGFFWRFDYRMIREFLDDHLEIEHILLMATVSKEWNYFCSDEKYDLLSCSLLFLIRFSLTM
jgi:hypothetical protein